MAVETKNMKWFLPVPNVQDLASQKLDTLPSRYVRDDIITTFPSNQSLRVPSIDMTNLVNPDTQAAELQKLHSACKEWGIFQLVKHGVSDESMKKMKKKVEEFFNLSVKDRERWAQKPGNSEGYGHAFVISEEQKLEWNDMIYLTVLPTENQKLESWPDNPRQFRETLVSYVEDMKQVAVSIMKDMAMGLEVTDEQFYKAYEKGNYNVRINIYPACPEPEKAIGIPPHIDVHAITLLQDYGDIPGLQVLKDGEWVYIEPIDGSIVVDLGGIMEIMSNGIYKSPIHRAVVSKSKERISIVTLCGPNSSFSIGPAKELVKKSGSPPLYKTVTLDEYLECFYTSIPKVPFTDNLKLN